MPRKANIPAGSAYWRKKWAYQKESGEYEDDLKRKKSRYELDKAGVDRKGKDVDHKKALRAGGSAKRSNLRLRDPSENRADNGHRKGEKAGKKFRG